MSTPTAEKLAGALRPLTEDPERAAVFCDIDGTLAPIVQRSEQAHVTERASLLLGALGRRYGCVACVSGRAAGEARRVVGVGTIDYVGSHGAELLPAGAHRAEMVPEVASWAGRVHEFAAEHETTDLRLARVRLEDKGPIVAFHWRGVPDEEAARAQLEAVAGEAESAGLAVHWGRKVLEVRPPVPLSKGQAVERLVERSGARTAMFGGDDATDLDAFDALGALARDGRLDAAVRVGVRSDEGPREIVERADLVVEGTRGFLSVLEALRGAVP